jgi:hypothetical protein
MRRLTAIARRCATAQHISMYNKSSAQLSVSHFSFSSRYFYNKTIVPRFFGFMRRNLAVACSPPRLLSTPPHYSRRPIVYVKIDGRTHNRDARRGQLSSFYSARPPPLCHLRAHYSAMMTRGNAAKIRHFFVMSRGRDKFFDFSTSTAAIAVFRPHANLYSARLQESEKIFNARSRTKMLTDDEFYKALFFI